MQSISANTIRLTLYLRQILIRIWALSQYLTYDRDKTQTSIKNWRKCRRKANCVKYNSLSSELQRLLEQLKYSHNFISFLNRVNDGGDLKFSASKFQSWFALQCIEFNPHLFKVGMWVWKALNCPVLQIFALAEKTFFSISGERPWIFSYT